MFRLSVFFVVALLATNFASGIFLGSSFLKPIKNPAEICAGVCQDAPKLWFSGSGSHQKILCEICKSKVTAFPFFFQNTNITITQNTTVTPSPSASTSSTQASSTTASPTTSEGSSAGTETSPSSNGSTEATTASEGDASSTEATTPAP